MDLWVERKNRVSELHALIEFIKNIREFKGVDVLSKAVVVLLEEITGSNQILVTVNDGDVSSPSLFYIESGLDKAEEGRWIQQTQATLQQSGMDLKSRGVRVVDDLDDRLILVLRGISPFVLILTIRQEFPEQALVSATRDQLMLIGNCIVMAMDAMERSSANTDLEKIITAKQEWETSIDHLPQLICFLDQDGTVLRANKTLETWYAGNVLKAKGRSIHKLLHPECHHTHCQLKEKWQGLWEKGSDEDRETIELYDHIIDRNLRLILQKSRTKTQQEHLGQSGAVLIIQDISETIWDRFLLESYSQELLAQVQDKENALEEMTQSLNKEKDFHNQARESLIKTESKLQSLSSQLLTAHEEERKRIACELHDSVGQSLSVVKLRLQGLKDHADSCDKSGATSKSVSGLLKVMDMTIEEVRRISMGLRPSILDDIGLDATLQWFTREFRESCLNIQLESEFAIDENALSKTQKVVIFRIIQESLNNIIKHAQASSVFVSLTANKHEVDLHIQDDGVGFTLADRNNPSGFGLSSMRERAKLSGGELVINSEPGMGTIIKGLWQSGKGQD